MSGSNADMKAYYAARAAEYDRVYQKPERQGDINRLFRAWGREPESLQADGQRYDEIFMCLRLEA